MVMVQNPWLALSAAAPYVLHDDEVVLRRHLRVWTQLYLDCPPIPWMGRPDKARVLLLTLNPAYADDVPDQMRTPGLQDDMLSALHLADDRPAHCLDARYRSTRGYRYWTRRLRELIDAVGFDSVAAGVAWLEFFPYFSRTYNALSECVHLRAPGQCIVGSAPRDSDIERRAKMACRCAGSSRSLRESEESQSPHGIDRQPRIRRIPQDLRGSLECPTREGSDARHRGRREGSRRGRSGHVRRRTGVRLRKCPGGTAVTYFTLQ